MELEGSCHCGNIRFVLQWPALQASVPVRKCGCDFCTRHGGAWTSHPESQLNVEASDPSTVSAYRFGTRTADFIVCTACGVVPLVLSLIEDTVYAVVNVNTFENVDSLTLSISSTDFDGEDRESRLDRRQRNWIRRVTTNLGTPIPSVR